MNKSFSLNDKAIFCKTSGAPNSPKTRLVYVCVYHFPPFCKTLLKHHIWYSVVLFRDLSRGTIDHIHSQTPISFNFLRLRLPSPHPYRTLTRPWLLLIIMSSTSYCSHLFTEPDNEPHWAVFGFHGVTRGVFLLDIYAFGCLCSWRRSFPFRQWGNHFSVLVFNIPAVFRIERAWMNMSGAFIWTQPLQIQKQ